ncbi:helix-turn-helix transcriptional regulator [Porphyrobacter sp. GA68]|uniref:ArsR/SmtB family transcription factor n=1 Tax=Porphyrobacter sp. GA68 TaxID=2883480 RepID=UPI001D18A15E|nr:metalloregulator ArsR/SmtB family transcription factor [Porphyrobacter sp. GA68]
MTDGELVDALKALAHPLRLRVMRALIAAERSVGQIEEAAGIGQPTLSQQLAVLRRAGLVRTRKEAKLVYYRIDETALADAVVALGGLGGTAPTSIPPTAPRRSPAGVANFARLS